MLEEKDFELLENESPDTYVSAEEKITDADFELVEVDSSVHEQKFQTKPTTFFKDSLRRFRKNKSSVVAAYILGGLLLLSFLVPVIDKSDLSDENPNLAYEKYLAPKLFKSGTGWWDGTLKYNHIAVDVSAKPDAKTEEEKQKYWWPSSTSFPQKSAISKKKFTDEQYTNNLSTTGSYGKEGYVQFGFLRTIEEGQNISFASYDIPVLSLDYNLYLSSFDTYDLEKVELMEGKKNLDLPENYDIGESAFYFTYKEGEETKEVQLVDYAIRHDIGSSVESLKKEKVDIASIIKEKTGKTLFESASFSVRMISKHHSKNLCSLIRSITFETDTTDTDVKQMFDDMSFTDATNVLTRKEAEKYKYWSCNGEKQVYLSKAYFCSFVYDTYEEHFGLREMDNFPIVTLLEYEKNGWISFKDDAGFPSLEQAGTGFNLYRDTFKCTILDPVKCPLDRAPTVDDFYGDEIPGNLQVTVYVQYYKFLGYEKVPSYLMGTDKNGRDMLKYVFEGLRTSLIIGFLTFAICFTFGLIWGSISGYFGGTVDLLMERFTDILAGIPWFVVMTLIILHLGTKFSTFVIAMCATGWIRTASLTRTQFYRFRGREYVLASRTLGASDARLIYKHILPNGLGTIITSAVLMIPGVIFTEANIAYLGLGLKGLSSLGVILSDNQSELMTSPYLLLFPAVVIALIMISFNLFGNGLRDAVNPSLKGED